MNRARLTPLRQLLAEPLDRQLLAIDLGLIANLFRQLRGRRRDREIRCLVTACRDGRSSKQKDGRKWGKKRYDPNDTSFHCSVLRATSLLHATRCRKSLATKCAICGLRVRSSQRAGPRRGLSAALS